MSLFPVLRLFSENEFGAQGGDLMGEFHPSVIVSHMV